MAMRALREWGGSSAGHKSPCCQSDRALQYQTNTIPRDDVMQHLCNTRTIMNYKNTLSTSMSATMSNSMLAGFFVSHYVGSHVSHLVCHHVGHHVGLSDKGDWEIYQINVILCMEMIPFLICSHNSNSKPTLRYVNHSMIIIPSKSQELKQTSKLISENIKF